MKIRMIRDYKDFEDGNRYDVDEKTAKNLFKLGAAVKDKIMTKGDIRRG